MRAESAAGRRRVIGEINDWKGHAPEQLPAMMKDSLARLASQGIEGINE